MTRTRWKRVRRSTWCVTWLAVLYFLIPQGAALAQPRLFTDAQVDQAIKICSVNTRTDIKIEGGLNLLKRRILSGEGAIEVSQIPSVIGTPVAEDRSKIELFEKIQKCILGYLGVPVRPGSGDESRRQRRSGWLVKFGSTGAGGGNFGDYGTRDAIVETPGSIDIRKHLPPGLSSRNVFVSLVATTDHEVLDPGSWIYFVKLIGAPNSYTQCTKFEVQSGGAPIWNKAPPILVGQTLTFDRSLTADLLAGAHSLSIHLDCYFQQREFPVVTWQLKAPNGGWRTPTPGDFTVLEPDNSNRPPNER